MHLPAATPSPVGARHPKATWRSRALLVAFALLYAVMVFGGYGLGASGSWCCDDTQILGHALRFAPWRYFVEPEAWRALIPFSLTPWLSLSYRIDLTLFGLDPAGFYVHQRLALAACAWLIHLLAWRSCGHLAAACGAVLFLAGVSTAQASQLLMVRHYVEGLLALLLCLWLVKQQVHRPRAWRAVAQALSFAAAASAKEVYLPLGLCALLAAEGPWRQRLRLAAPVLLVMVLYIPWRMHMLGELVGGYTPAGDLSTASLLLRAGQQIAAAPSFLFGHPAPALSSLALLLTLALARRWQLQGGVAAGRVLMAGLVVLALLLVPLLPLTVFPASSAGPSAICSPPGQRWPWWSRRLRRRHAGRRWPLRGLIAALALSVAAMAWPPALRALAETRAAHREHQAHFERLTRGGAADVVLASPSITAWFITGALALRPPLGQNGPPPMVVVDEAQLAGLAEGRRLWHDDGRGPQMVDATAAVQARLADWRGRLRVRPLRVSMSYDGASLVLRWDLQAADDPGGGASRWSPRTSGWPCRCRPVRCASNSLCRSASASATMPPTAASRTASGCACRWHATGAAICSGQARRRICRP
ncbi:MAG: hypothetical protein IPM99_08515 [Rubrivivax sp.]|nr:hypothetical protein [Rubrivivax sp.]